MNRGGREIHVGCAWWIARDCVEYLDHLRNAVRIIVWLPNDRKINELTVDLVPSDRYCVPEILLVLLRHGNEVVTKDDLMETVWPDTFVEESNLTSNISIV